MADVTDPRFWKSFDDLPTEKLKDKAREVFQIWKEDPRDPRLRYTPLPEMRCWSIIEGEPEGPFWEMTLYIPGLSRPTPAVEAI